MQNNLFGYIKLGRLYKKIAAAINIKTANIFIEYNSLRHIEKGRYFTLEKLKVNTLVYVQKIINNYTEIRQGKENRLLLVAYLPESDIKNIAVVELQIIEKKSIYLVKTAMPRRKFTKKEIILWQK